MQTGWVVKLLVIMNYSSSNQQISFLNVENRLDEVQASGRLLGVRPGIDIEFGSIEQA